MKKNVYEVFNEFKMCETDEERIDVLRRNDSKMLRNVLLGTYHPGIQFTIKEIPTYKKVDIPPGMSYSNLNVELDRIYLFMENNPRTPKGLTEKRKIELLIQMLEALEPKEAEVLSGILLKEQNVPHLTSNLINAAFPGLLP